MNNSDSKALEQKPNHECEHFLMTDIAVHGCECGSIQVSGFGNSTEYLPIEQFEALQSENQRLTEEVKELKDHLLTHGCAFIKIEREAEEKVCNPLNLK